MKIIKINNLWTITPLQVYLVLDEITTLNEGTMAFFDHYFLHLFIITNLKIIYFVLVTTITFKVFHEVIITL